MSIRHVGATARLAIRIAAAIVLLAVAVPPAAAVQYEKVGHYDDTDAWSYGDCGFDVSVEARFWGTFAMRAGTGPDAGAFFARNTYFFEEVHTRDGGPTIYVSGHGRWIEVTGTQVEGSIFEFTVVNAGQPLEVRDEDGQLIVLDRGLYRERVLFDTLGDDVPGGEFVDQLEWTVRGPHPSEGLDWCGLFD